MARRMLIDSSHPEEIRVAVVSGKRLEEFDYETSRKRQLKGNVYLAKVVRVEPSLQAAFVDYGGNRHGFLAFSEIHPDYYQIPVADREQLLAEEGDMEDAEESENGTVETVGGDDADELERRRLKHYRHYKIQEVIKRRQIMLVQVVKEERGNKGAALTTYLSLAGRYCVLMPNTARGGGISRKISSQKDRRRLKKVLDELDIAAGTAVIVRTAGAERTKAEIKRDYEYLVRLWDEIRTKTMESIAPTLVHEEANLIKRAIRDLYNKDIDEVLVDGEEGYRVAKGFMKSMVPSHAKRVQRYEDPKIPLFFRYQVESQIDAIYNPVVQLRSGGYLVIHATEALVAIDVNSGRATRERHIEETALKTNLEAAEEVARQLRLRDLAGLIVIDFIDMEENRNNTAVERRLKEALRNERARIQIGHISPFGLLEMSRQRLRPSLLETSSEICPSCGGTGHIRSTESTVLHVMRGLEEEGLRNRSIEVTLFVPTKIALYILNHKRETLAAIEKRCEMTVSILADDTLIPPEYRIERVRGREAGEAAAEAEEAGAAAEPAEEGRRKRRSRRRRKDRAEVEGAAAGPATPAEEAAQPEGAAAAETSDAEQAAPAEEEPRRRRRRGKRGGRRRGRKSTELEAVAESVDGDTSAPARELVDDDAEPPATPAVAEETAEEEKPAPRRRRSRRKSAEAETAPAVEAAATPGADAEAAPADVDTDGAPAPAPADSGVAVAADAQAETEAETEAEAEAEAEAKKPARRSRRKATTTKPRTAKAKSSGRKPARRTATKKPAAAPVEPAAETTTPGNGDLTVPPEPAPAPDLEPAEREAVDSLVAANNDAAPDEPSPAAGPKRTGWWRRTLSK